MMEKEWVDDGTKKAGMKYDLLSFGQDISVWRSPIPKRGKNLEFRKKEEHPAPYSIMLVQRLIELYTKENDKVLDLMMGTGTMMPVAKSMKRHSIGIDCVPEYVGIAQHYLDQQRISKEFNDYESRVMIGDARKLPLDNESIDCIISSPPYWNMVKYRNADNQIGNFKDYIDYLREMEKVFKECHRVLKKEKFCNIIVSDIRKGKDGLVPIHADLIKIAQDVGFILWDIRISQRQIFSIVSKQHRKAVSNKHSVRVHEYILTFKKGDKNDDKR